MKKRKKHIVIGRGEVGRAVSAVLADAFDVSCIDKGETADGPFDTMHVCIPYSPRFVRIVRDYAKLYAPRIVVVHSSVPVGTCAKLSAVHSPVRGVHPHLEQGIRTFVKLFGGHDARQAARMFEACKVKTSCTPLPETTEAAKLWDTTIYGLNITLEKIIHAYCKKRRLPFDIVYTLMNKTYNAGYAALGRPEYAKYVLKHVDGPIGGHCVLNNCRLLGGPAADFVLAHGE